MRLGGVGQTGRYTQNKGRKSTYHVAEWPENIKNMSIKIIARLYALVIKFGLLTGLAVILFEVINLFVLYRQIKLDYYLSLVAVLFFFAGLYISRNPGTNSNTINANQQSINHQLTAKEMEVLALIAAGKANKQIAELLFVEISTVKTHINNIYTKLSVANRRDAKTKFAEITRTTA